MAFGFPAYAVGSERFNLEKNLLTSAIMDTLKLLNWRCESATPDQVVAKIQVNLWSWGERLTISLNEDGIVAARSEGVLPTQCIDWGKNQRNIAKFFDELERAVTTLESSVVPRRSLSQFDEAGRTPVERVFGDAEENT